MIYHPQQVLEDVNGQLDYGKRSYRPTDITTSANRHQSEVTQSSDALNVETGSVTTVSQPEPSHIKSPRSANVVPEHLTQIYEQLDWHGQDLDALIIATQLAPPQLIGQLMGLELMGVISVQGGRYLRV